MSPQSIFAIDPGTTESAFLIWNGATIEHMGIHPNEEILEQVKAFAPKRSEHMAIEMVASYGMSVGREVFETVLWIGRFIEAWASRGASYQKVYRLEVKRHLCHDTRAKDGNIRQALIDRFGPPGVKSKKGVLYGVSKHLWSALAVAVTAHDQFPTP